MFLIKARTATSSMSMGAPLASEALEMMKEFARNDMIDIECLDDKGTVYTVEHLEALAGAEI